MSSSSEEDFTDEEIDLDALWRDPIFLSDDETEDEPEIEDKDGKPIVLELKPISEIIEKDEPPTVPQAFIDAVKALGETVDKERAQQAISYSERLLAARQRIVDIGTIGSHLAEASSNLNGQQPTWTPSLPRSGLTAQTHREDISMRLSQLRLRRPLRAIRRQMSGQTNNEINSNVQIFPRNIILRSQQQRRTLDTIREAEKKDANPEIDIHSLLVPDNSSNDESLTSSSSDSSLSS